jgi:hypothetical protein
MGRRRMHGNEMAPGAWEAANLGLVTQAAFAGRNRAFSTGSATAPTGVTNAMALIIGAALLNVRGSGIFHGAVTLSLTGITATDTILIQIGSQTVASGMTLSNNTKVGPGTGAATNGAFVSSMAAGIVVAGGGGALVQYSSGTQVAGTAATTLDFAWSNTFQNSISSTAAENPFASTTQILLTVTITATHSATQVYSGFAIDLVEMP